MKLLLSFLFALLMLTGALKAEARNLTPVEGLEALRRSFGTMQDFTADLTQEKQLSIMKKKLVMQGQIRFKKPDRFYMELVPPYSSKVLLKDTVLLQRLGNQGELQRIVLPPEQGLSRWFATLAKPITAVPEGMEVRAEQTGSQTSVTMIPNPAYHSMYFGARPTPSSTWAKSTTRLKAAIPTIKKERPMLVQLLSCTTDT